MTRSGRFMRLPLVAAMLMSAVARTSESSSGGGGRQAESCAYRVLHQDRAYQDIASVGFTVGGKLGSATVPPCDDTGSKDAAEQAGETTTAYQVDGVSPEVAVAVGDSPDDTTSVAVHSGDELPSEIRKLIDGS